MIYKSI